MTWVRCLGFNGNVMKKRLLSLVIGMLGGISSTTASQAGALSAGNPDRKERWEHRSSDLAGRIFHTAVWTGQKMMVWGGGGAGQFFNDGGIYDPGKNQWEPITTESAPAPRWGHAAVWTGCDMLVWGGRSQFQPTEHKNSGGCYFLAKNQWKPMTQVGAPEPRSHLAAVWTGYEMLVWGGWGDAGVAYSNGGRYDPAKDEWTALPPADLMPRMDPAFVWTGTEFIIWGGAASGGSERTYNDGARYNPKTGTWTLLPTEGAPPSARCLTAFWTGEEMLVWGGYHVGAQAEFQNQPIGARYNPKTDTWKPIAANPELGRRVSYAAVWTDREMVVWSGGGMPGPSALEGGARYNPVTDSWTPMTRKGEGRPRSYASGIWTGEGALFFGGSIGGFEAFNDLDYWEAKPLAR